MIDSATALILERGIRRGVLTLLRERSFLTTVAALTGILVIAQLLVVVVIGMQGLDQLIRQRADLRLEILDASADQRNREFFAAVQAQPQVESARYVTREQAYEEERRRDPDLIARIEQFHLENPFPDTIAVVLRRIDDYDAFSKFIQSAEWHDVVNPAFLSQATNQEQRIRELLGVTHAARVAAGLFLFLATVVLLFILMEVVRRRSLMRSEEVFIERLFGAGNVSVVVPFATESLALLGLSLLLSILFLLGVLALLPTLIPALQAGGAFDPLRQAAEPVLRHLLPATIGLEIIFAPLLGIMGAAFGLWPQLTSRKLVAV